MQPIESESRIFGLFFESRDQRYLLRCGEDTPIIGIGYTQIGNVVVPDYFFKKRSFVSEENAAIAIKNYKAKILN